MKLSTKPPAAPDNPDRIPQQLGECHRLIRSQMIEIEQLRKDLATVSAELEVLRAKPRAESRDSTDGDLVARRATLRQVWQQVSTRSSGDPDRPRWLQRLIDYLGRCQGSSDR